MFAISLLSDYNLKISDTLHSKLKSGLETHLDFYNLKELSYLSISISAQSNFKNDECFRNKVKDRIIALIDQNEDESIQD